MEMPILKPLPIQTKGQSVFKRAWLWLTSTRKWEVVVDYVFPFECRILIIPKGFVFDGASVPRIFRSALSPTGLLLIPGLFHDYGYRYNYLWEMLPEGRQMCLEGAGKVFWDKMFMRIGDHVNGVYAVNAVAWMALTVGGFAAWNGNRDRGCE